MLKGDVGAGRSARITYGERAAVRWIGVYIVLTCAASRDDSRPRKRLKGNAVTLCCMGEGVGHPIMDAAQGQIFSASWEKSCPHSAQKRAVCEDVCPCGHLRSRYSSGE